MACLGWVLVVAIAARNSASWTWTLAPGKSGSPPGVVEVDVGEHDVAHVFGRIAQAGDLVDRGLTGLQDGCGAVQEGPAERLLGAFDIAQAGLDEHQPWDHPGRLRDQHCTALLVSTLLKWVFSVGWPCDEPRWRLSPGRSRHCCRRGGK